MALSVNGNWMMGLMSLTTNSPMPRPQFTLRALLVAMLVVGAFFGGMSLQRQFKTPAPTRSYYVDKDRIAWIIEEMTTPDGKRWNRHFRPQDEPDAD